MMGFPLDIPELPFYCQSEKSKSTIGESKDMTVAVLTVNCLHATWC